MRIRIIILLILFSSCVHSQEKQVLGVVKSGYVAPPPEDTSTVPIMIVTFGESNSGGYANNEFGTIAELAERDFQILRNDSYVFDELDIGANNLMGHFALPCCETHGIELQLANSLDSGYFSNHPVYMVKGGQGGSRIHEWETTDAYYDTLLFRIETGFDLIVSETGRRPDIFIVFSQGINDILASVPAATWKPLVIDVFDNLRTDINTIVGEAVVPPIFMMRFDGMPTNLAYETVIGEIDSEVTDCTAISIICSYGDCSDYLRDDNHLQYKGQKQFGRRVVDLILTYYEN